MLISVVIPCYNAECYIAECLDSVLAQSYGKIEIICVNDCSTDGTLEILEEYSQRDEKIRVIKRETNSGSARIPRTEGIRAAKGELICAIDADDTVSKDYIEKLYNRYVETGRPEIVFGRMDFKKDGDDNIIFSIPDEKFNFNKVMEGKQAVLYTIKRWRIGANGGLISRDLILRQRQHHPDMNHMNADEYDTRDMILMAGSVAFADVPYFYRLTSDSITMIPERRCETLITDRMLVGLFEEHFGSSSRVYRTSVRQLVYNLKSTYRNLKDISGKPAEIIKETCAFLSFRMMVKAHVPLKSILYYYFRIKNS